MNIHTKGQLCAYKKKFYGGARKILDWFFFLMKTSRVISHFLEAKYANSFFCLQGKTVKKWAANTFAHFLKDRIRD